VIRDVSLAAGDSITIEGIPDAMETAALDYVEIQPHVDRKQ
jgi:hypothetical protein